VQRRTSLISDMRLVMQSKPGNQYQNLMRIQS
jgi:hypothetical protein